MKEIQVGRGRVALVDDEDYDFVLQHRWSLSSSRKSDTHRRYASNKALGSMHRAILKHHGVSLDGKVVDHINGNGLDNTKSNLRPCSNAENVFHSKLNKLNTSGFSGVSFSKSNSKWVACIGSNKLDKQVIGYFISKRDAAIARDIKAQELYPGFVRFNVPDVSTEDLNRISDLLSRAKTRTDTSSQWLGVSRSGPNWHAYVTVDGRQHQLGRHEDETVAAKVHDWYIIKQKLDKSLNFPFDPSLVTWVDSYLDSRTPLKRNRTTSRYRGVTKLTDQPDRPWRASLDLRACDSPTGKRTSKYLGSFTTEQEAALAYNQKVTEMFGEKAILNRIIT